MKNGRYQNEDVVRIIGNISGHNFKKGSEVVVQEVGRNNGHVLMWACPKDKPDMSQPINVADIELIEDTDQPKFPNGFIAWYETFYQGVEAITEAHQMRYSTAVIEVHEAEGHKGLFDLARCLTDGFEELHAGEQWEDKDYYDAIEEYMIEKLSGNIKTDSDRMWMLARVETYHKDALEHVRKHIEGVREKLTKKALIK